ncbi:hypothetical protein CsSME_00039493 [Camellia sinensis var. sinensis]
MRIVIGFPSGIGAEAGDIFTIGDGEGDPPKTHRVRFIRFVDARYAMGVPWLRFWVYRSTVDEFEERTQSSIELFFEDDGAGRRKNLIFRKQPDLSNI